MSETIEIHSSDNQIIRGLYKKPEKGASSEKRSKLILMMHDFPGNKSSHGDLYGQIEASLVKKGFHTLRFDFTGCGESDGEQQNFSLTTAKQDIEAVKAWAREKGHKEFSYVSEGIGTTCALLSMDLDVTCQVMLWPGLNPPALAKDVFKADTVEKEWEKFGYTIQNGARIGANFINTMTRSNLAPYFRDITMPVLILHGTEDDRFPIEDLDIIRKRASSRRIEITTFHEGGYGLPLPEHRESMFFHIGQFLEKYA